MSQATAKVTSCRAAVNPASRPASGPAASLRSNTSRKGTSRSTCSGSAKETTTSENAGPRRSTTQRKSVVSPTSSQALGRPMRRLSPPASTNSVACMPTIIGLALRAIDFHVHLPTPEWLDASMQGYIEAAESYFRSKVVRRSLDDLARDYADPDVLAVLLAWDAETATGRPRVPNELVAQACRDHPESFIGFGSVDPLKGDRAVAELDRINELGLKGVKLHPSLQAFAPDDEKHWPLYERCEELGLIILFHTGTSGIGAGQPGGQGIRLDYARPIRLDAVAASFPNLKVIAAHFGYPWHTELLAMALHKTNIYIDISGWAPRYIPAEVIRDMKGRLQDQFLFGSDYPFLQPKRCLDELSALELPEAVLSKVLIDNGKRLLGLS